MVIVMNIKKQVMQDLAKRLQRDHQKVLDQIEMNRLKINEAAERNTVLKRELVEITKLIRSIKE